MHVDPNAPADTTMMRIVHDALRRDLERSRLALTQNPPPDDRRRVAIAVHLRWMMTFLHAHHRSEDEGLYPFVRRRNAAAGALLDSMTADHEAVAIAVAELDAAAADYAQRDDREAVVAALGNLSEVLIPHLRREEDEAMPVVSRTITNAEWSAIEQQHNLDGKSKAQLGMEGHWLIDDADPDDRNRVLGLVPPVQRLVLLHGFGPSYRRRKRARWIPSGRRVQRNGSTAVLVDAGIDDVWEVVRDPTRVGEWSHECIGGEWVGEAAEARPGARFRGLNKQGHIRWGRLSEVVSAEAYELVWRTVPTRLYPDSTEWALRLTPVEDGTRIEQTFQVVKGTVLEPLYATIAPAHRDRRDALRQDLERIGTVAMTARDPIDF